MKTFNLLNKLAFLCATTIILATSCKKDKDSTSMAEETAGPDLNFVALTADNRIMTINAKNVSAAISTSTITGLQASETIAAIDFRPATGELYGISNASRIYIINIQSGIARAVNPTPFTPAIAASANGAGFDFNPTVDRIRYVGVNGQNLRLNPETGTVASTDGVINGATNATISAVAYTQNRAGAATTVLFDIDITNDKLYKQDPPNDGKLVEVGNLTVNAESTAGFDINPAGTSAIAALTVSGTQGLYTIDLNTGKAVKIMNNLPAKLIGIAIPTEPVAYGITASNELSIFNPLSPTPVLKPLSGLQTGETILGLDFRPVNGQLYALGSTSRIYTINASSGVAAAVGTVPLTTLLSGTDFGFDFNPVVDRIRVVSNTGQNLRLNPNDGLIAAIDLQLNPGTPSITAAAYTNNFAGTGSTVLYDIDTQNNRLYKQDPPNAGSLVDVGPLGLTASASNGFDIGSTSGVAYALLTVGGVTKVYTINLTSGAATAGATVTGNLKAFTLGLGF